MRPSLVSLASVFAAAFLTIAPLGAQEPVDLATTRP